MIRILKGKYRVLRKETIGWSGCPVRSEEANTASRGSNAEVETSLANAKN